MTPLNRLLGAGVFCISALVTTVLISSGSVNNLLAATFHQDDDQMPALDGAVAWINSPPLTAEGLKGKVVLVDFWTYDCINCRRSLPYVNQWAKRYAKDGLVVIGVHTPENAYEKIIDNVRSQVQKLGIDYPVAVDNNYTIWRAFDNQYWPAHYFFDATGKERYSHFGEGRYETQEKVIQTLLEEASKGKAAP